MSRKPFPQIMQRVQDPDEDLSGWGRPMGNFNLFGRHPDGLRKQGIERRFYSHDRFDIRAARTLNFTGPEPGPYVAGHATIEHGVFEIDNAVMLFPNGMMVLPERDDLIVESCWQTAIQHHPAFRGNRSTKWRLHTEVEFSEPFVKDAGEVVHCYHRFYHQYFHWFIDCVPRLWLMNKLAPKDLPVILGDIKPGSPQHKTMQLMGIDIERLFYPEHPYQRFSRAYCAFSRLEESLHVRPSFVDGIHYKGGWDPEFLHWLNDAFRQAYKDVPVKTGRRIYVDRSGAAHRRLANAKPFHQFLRDNDFDFVDPGSHSFEEQVAIFDKAEIVVGPHGAGLANLLWCNPKNDIRVVEIGINTVYDTGYTLISSGLGFRHDVIFGEPLPHVHGKAFADLDVDSDRLIALVKDKLS